MQDTMLNQVVRLYACGELDPALEAAERVLQANPHHGRAWEIKGLIHAAAGQLHEALHALESASTYVPLQASARCALAECYLQLGKTELTAVLLRDLLSDEPLCPEFMLRIARGLDRICQSELALDVCRRAAALDPNSAQAHYDMSYYLGRCGRSLQLIESVARRAINLAPDCVKYRIGLAALLSRAGRTQDAYRLVERLNSEQLQSVTCRCCLERVREIYEEAGDWERALYCRQSLMADSD